MNKTAIDEYKRKEKKKLIWRFDIRSSIWCDVIGITTHDK